ncbi:hypothetical protein BT93_L3603 [Corymbia citriodora subsp. variegata]|uniref:Secreted protein n=1 Tax=Corymbia citriodora subsp. variegata TaxID=360336 RepID=A0A8T0CM63_CORYI|nr:hypothetical protein BT93_L3603 [Corymbia citriodora subsp. variegata]
MCQQKVVLLILCMQGFSFNYDIGYSVCSQIFTGTNMFKTLPALVKCNYLLLVPTLTPKNSLCSSAFTVPVV